MREKASSILCFSRRLHLIRCSIGFDARRAFHGRKASGYYGETQRQLEHALRQGLKIKAELRFFIEKGATSLQVPEDVIMGEYNIQPIFDLGAGSRMDPAAKNQ